MPVLRSNRSRRLLPALVLTLLPVALTGQVREVVSNQIAVSQSEAGLVLEFADEGSFEIQLRDGAVIVDDEVVGSFDRGDVLDTAWRALLGEVVSLSDGPLAEALRAWAPPTSLSGDALAVAQILDTRLDEALGARVQVDPSPEIDADASAGLGASLRALLSRTDVLADLGRALEEIDVPTSSIHIGEDVVVQADETVEETVIVLDGALTVSGTIEGDVVVVEGSITVHEGGNVNGDIRLVDSRYLGIDESSLGGRVIRIDSGETDIESSAAPDLEDLEDRIREEVRSELRHEFRDTDRGFSPLRAVGHAIAELMGDLVSFLVLSLVALGVVYVAKDNLEIVADTARRNPLRAGMVGLAGMFLVLPTWVVGCVALVASIVGIIALPFWLLLFPIAVALGAGLGFLAAARNIGEWVAAREINGLEWLRPTNTFYAVVAGVGTVVAFSVAANVLEIVPFFGFLGTLVATLGSVIAILALLVGFGAVLLTRGGRQSEFYGGADLFSHGGVWEEDRFSDEVIEVEDVDGEPGVEVGEEHRAKATADETNDETESAGETPDGAHE